MLNFLSGPWSFWWALGILALMMVARPAMGMPPLTRLQKEHLAAAEILIGQVEGVRSAPAAFREQKPPGVGEDLQVFTLQVGHVVKSQVGAQPGSQVTVLFSRGKENIPEMGPPKVRVSPGDLIIVYANPKEQDGHRVLVPVWAGFSVVRLGPPPKPGEAVRAPGPGKPE